ncbi:MAG: response regulator [Bacteroidota bacterium]|nr:response regulator [Bacteroidota bacterium]
MNKNKQINIFIVEDNKVFTLALKADIETTFSKMPIKIQSFETSEMCMEKFKEEIPQIVITDYHLNSKYPDAMDGIQLLDWIKKENSETSVVILTGDEDLNIALKAFHHGASDYVVKTETKFRKLNYSLANIFKIIDAKEEVKKNKNQVIGLIGALVLIAGVVLVTSLLRV